ncbi:MAG: hypothetical protein Q9162_005018 [Coniocarpon cinnabarinum]
MARKSAVSPSPISPTAVSSSAKPSSAASSQSGTTSSTKGGTAPPTKSPTTPGAKAGQIRNPQDAQEIVLTIWRKYVDETPQRVKGLDAFLGFLAIVGAVQFLYCLIVGNYPFNAFLAGFSATVGQFVLTASLRIQTNPANRSEFKSVSDERAFADFVFGSLILHFFCVNFIN